MAEGLQQLRKNAGYKSARDFAETHDMSPSTYARYEGDPSSIPLKAAWKMADELECSIDDVVGRDVPESAKRSIQRRYDALDEAGRALVEEIMEFAEGKFVEREELARRRRNEEIKSKFSLYFIGLAHEMAQAGTPLEKDEDKTEEFRERFRKYAMDAIVEAGSSKGATVEEEAMEFDEVMQAYEAWVSGNFYDD